MTSGDLEHFGLEFRNTVFTIVFVDPENLPVDTTPMLLSIIVGLFFRNHVVSTYVGSEDLVPADTDRLILSKLHDFQQFIGKTLSCLY